MVEGGMAVGGHYGFKVFAERKKVLFARRLGRFENSINSETREENALK